jgi:hypothetical protein
MFEQYFITIEPRNLDKGAAQAYQAGVESNLSKLLKTASGQILLQSIAYNARRFASHVKIVPYDGAMGRCNAYVETEPTAARKMAALVLFSPQTWSRSGPCARFLKDSTHNKATLPDEVLFHELVHTLRTLAQITKMPNLSGGLYRYDDFDEFCAILATNIHISDRTNRVRTGLSSDHHGGRPLEKELSGSLKFFQSGGNTFHWVERFCGEDQGFTKLLAGLKADFNPLAAYYYDQQKARAISQSSLAQRRDSSGFGQQADDYGRKFFGNLAAKRHPRTP